MSADLVETQKKSLTAAPAHRCHSTAGDVACDSCRGKKLEALKSCLVRRVSYCELHIQPHYESPAFLKHKLVEPLKNLQEKFCSRHNELMKIFCCSDQQTVCILCCMDEHKGHDTVTTALERSRKQSELEISQQKIQKRFQDREKDVKVLQQELEAINGSADKAVEDSEKIFAELIRVLETRCSDVEQQIRSQQEAEVSRVRKPKVKLEQEITELCAKDSELGQLSHTHDHIQFLQTYPVLSRVSEGTDSPSFYLHPLQYFNHVTAAVTEARDKLLDILNEEWMKISLKGTEVDVLLPQPEPSTREEFLKYSRQITLDPSTVNPWLSLSTGNRKATVMREKQVYSSHPDRFTDWLQALSAEGLTGHSYWEVERSSGGVSVGVAYKDISRTGSESGFGNNDRSWALGCFDMSYYIRYNNIRTLLSGPQSSRVGLYLDHKAGTLSFYSVSETIFFLFFFSTKLESLVVQQRIFFYDLVSSDDGWHISTI